ncbi:tetratricopeptide repeat protein [Microbulbifer sp. CAU 1566]|uniref:tetratricopeptide repeat protein n=1 Tax=Microbulbifer sp. CAU 1566 TaxID=2933269 RepID=UPI002005782D|nr:tetratricopeptide repeat protein [Microbulbifer sp. CAU 1566]MCK7595722.1 tetratricopeptide repeat protein [Microbulbifer sp. CAU 1566]
MHYKSSRTAFSERPVTALCWMTGVAFNLVLGVSPGVALDSHADSQSVSSDTQESAIEILYQQADFWEDHNRGDLSRNALHRILASDAGDLTARYRLGLSYAKENDLVAAGLVVRELYGSKHGKAYADQLASEIKSRSFDERAVARARNLSENDHHEEAVAIYEGLFAGREPNGPMAIEMYYAMSAVEQFREVAISGLERLINNQPGNRDAQLALARVLTYEEGTRRQGLDLLDGLNGAPGASDTLANDKRNALLWLQASPGDLQRYEEYLEKHPEDDEIRQKHSRILTSVDPNTSAGQVAIGYRYLNAGRPVQAEQAFQQALSLSRDEVDALAGLSIILHRRGQHDQAMALLRQAESRDAKTRLKFSELRQSVSFWSQLGLAEKYLAQEKPDEARHMLTSMSTSDNSQQLELSLMNYKVALSSGESALAERWLRESMKINSADERAQIALLDLYLDRRNLTGLAAIISQHDKQNGSRPVSTLLQSKLFRCKAILAESRNENQLAGEFFRKGIEQNDSDVWIRLDFARYLARTRDEAAGTEEAEKIPVVGRIRNDGLLARALYFNEQQHWAKVVRYLQGIDVESQTPDGERILREALFRQNLESVLAAGELRGGTSVEGALLRLYESETSIPDRAVFLVDAMQTLNLQSTAVAIARQALGRKRHELSIQSQLALIRFLIDQGVVDTGGQIISELEQSPDIGAAVARDIAATQLHLEHHFALENIRKKNFRKADEHLASANRLDPGNTTTLRLRGQLARSEGRFGESVRFYQQAIKANPKDLWAIKGAVGSAIVDGDLKMARSIVQAALIELPEEPDVYELISQIAQSAHDADLAIEAMAYSRKLKRRQ